jgi:hypothetical protein
VPAVVTFDPTNHPPLIIEIDTGGDNELDWLEIYSEWKVWSALSDNLKYPPAFRVVGGDPISGTANLGSTFFLLAPWKFRPAEQSHRLTMVGNVFSDPAGANIITPTLGAFTVLVEQRVSNLTDATFVNAPEVQQSTFANAVAVDPASPHSGTTYPVGTRESPVNNLADAKAIALARGFTVLQILRDTTVSGIDLDGFTFVGDNPGIELTVDASASVESSAFERLAIEGTLSGVAYMRDCFVLDVSNWHGRMDSCYLGGTITLSGAGQALLAACRDALAGFGTPMIDMNGAGSSLVMMGYHGGVEIENKTGVDEVSLNLSSARIVLAATVGGTGAVIVRGVGQLTDNSSLGVLLDDSGLVNKVTIATATDAVIDQFLPADRTLLEFVHARRKNRWRIDKTLKKAYLYADDGVTVIQSFTLVAEGGGAIVVPTGAIIDMIPDP